MDVVREYIDGQGEGVRERLLEVYAVLKEALPDAEERISYRMPTFWKGRNLIHFAAFKEWIGLFPGGEATTAFAEKLAGYETSKGGIRFPHGRPLPLGLIQEIALWCGERNGR